MESSVDIAEHERQEREREQDRQRSAQYRQHAGVVCSEQYEILTSAITAELTADDLANGDDYAHGRDQNRRRLRAKSASVSS